MAGLVKSAMPEDEEMPEREYEAPGEEDSEGEVGQEGGQGLTPQAVREQMKLPPDMQEAYDRVVLAGMKIMFSPETSEMAMNVIAGDGPIDERLGEGIATLMGTMVKQSNNTMPPQLVIPAGVELLVAAGDYLKQSGAEPITDDDIGGALAVFSAKVLEAAGAKDPETLKQMLQQAGGGMPQGAPQPGAAPAPGGPPQPPVAPKPGGIVSQAMEA